MTETALRKAVRTFDLSEHAERLDDRERDASYGLLVMVVGAGNFGKSSLVNALCGRPVAPVSIIPKTFKIDVFSSGAAGRALVRRVGQSRPVECSQDEARRIETEEEARKGSGATPPLAEIVWRYDDLTLPRGISLVDTPGISQALHGAAKSVSLTKVLGSTFEVDEVWAHWFHRADVVIWAFCANKMEDSDTRAALESALDLFDKPILPVATKADLIPEARWQEVHERFKAMYGPLLKKRQASDLHLTVCAGSKAALVGAGIQELRASLTEIAEDAEAVKVHAEAAFVRDESKAVAEVLDETAKSMVSNLRAIATLGDSLAVEAVKEAERGRHEAFSRVNSYLRTIRNSPRLDEAAKAVHEATNGGRTGDIEAEARQRLVELVDQHQIERHVNEAYAMGARALEAVAGRLSQGTEIVRLSFRSSGKITRSPIPLKLKLKALSITSKLEFPVQLNDPSGFFGAAWDLLKGVFGIERFSVSHIHSAMSSALDIPVSGFDNSMRQALYNGFAPALREAVESALKEHLKAMDSRALILLKEVDRHVPELDPPGARARVTTYGPQGEYWATLHPAVETLLNMAREELTRQLPKFKAVLVEPFPFDGPDKYPPFYRVWRRRTLDAKVVKVEVELRELIREAQFREPIEEVGTDRTRWAPFAPHLLAMQTRHLEEAPLIEELDERLAECVVGAHYRSAGSRMVQVGAQAFQSSCEASTRTWSASVTHEQVGPLSFGKGTVIGAILAWALGGGLLFFRSEYGFLLFVVSVIWVVYGLARPFLDLLSLYETEIAEAVLTEVRTCQRDSAATLPPNTVEQVVSGMTAELAPRPLQKLLIEAGHLDR